MLYYLCPSASQQLVILYCGRLFGKLHGSCKNLGTLRVAAIWDATAGSCCVVVGPLTSDSAAAKPVSCWYAVLRCLMIGYAPAGTH
jgi:hypothetical protein